MSDLTTTNLKQLLDQATPGPWKVGDTELPDSIASDSGRGVLWNSDQAVSWCYKDEDVYLAALAPELAQEVIQMRSELAAMRRAWLSVVNDLQRMTIEKDLAAHVLVHIDSILGETND